MKRTLSSCACVLVLVISVLGAESKSQPNIIFVLSDDQAWNGLSTRMHPDLAWSASDFVRTPNIARLAKQGTRFSAAYAPASVCSPIRISLQTEKSPAQLQWTKAAPTMTAAKKLIKENNK